MVLGGGLSRRQRPNYSVIEAPVARDRNKWLSAGVFRRTPDYTDNIARREEGGVGWSPPPAPEAGRSHPVTRERSQMAWPEAKSSRRRFILALRECRGGT